RAPPPGARGEGGSSAWRALRSSEGRCRSARAACSTGRLRVDKRPAAGVCSPAMAEEPTPLAEVRVVEWTSGLAGAYAGFLLAGLGAEVIRIESAAPRAGAGDHVVNRNKRSVTLDLARAPDRACWEALVAGTDAVVGDESAPQIADAPGLVDCRLSGWDGRTDLPPDEALLAAATGVQAMQWSWSRRPVWLVTPVIGYM